MSFKTNERCAMNLWKSVVTRVQRFVGIVMGRVVPSLSGYSEQAQHLQQARNLERITLGLELLQAHLYDRPEDVNVSPPVADTLARIASTPASPRTELSAHLRMLVQDLRWHTGQHTDFTELVEDHDVQRFGGVMNAYLINHHRALVTLIRRVVMRNPHTNSEYFQVFENMGQNAWIHKENRRRFNMVVAGYHFVI